MPKYKVGDIAASLPQPKAPATKSGKKLHSLFNEFYNKNENKSFQANDFSQVKHEDNSLKKSKKKVKHEDNSLKITPNSAPASDDVAKGKKRKKSQLSNSISDESNEFARQEKKHVSHSNQQDFPRRKKFKGREVPHKATPKYFHDDQPSLQKQSRNSFQDDEKLQAQSKNSIFDESQSKMLGKKKDVSYSDQQDFPRRKKFKGREVGNEATHSYFHDDQPRFQKQFPNSFQNNEKLQAQSKNFLFDESQSKMFGKKSVFNKKNVNFVHKKRVQDFENTKNSTNDSFKMKNQNKSNNISTLEFSNKKHIKKFKKTNSDFVPSNNQNSPISKPYQKNTIVKSEDSVRERKQLKLDSVEQTCRTISIRNLPTNIRVKELRKLFVPFGAVQNVRLRGAIPVKKSIGKKMAVITGEYHKGLTSLLGFVVFRDEKEAQKALVLNGMLLNGHHIMVANALPRGEKVIYDHRRTIFVGNLPYDMPDESLWNAFSQCGEIDTMRVIRDTETGDSRGFGYVSFVNAAAKENALALENVKIGGRTTRITPVVKSNPNQKKEPATPKIYFNSFKGAALRLKKKSENTASRKTTKKIMKKQQLLHKKKQISQILQKKMH